jgi:non-ribosomal peptide synthetase component F
LAPSPVQYGDFTLWQRERLSGARLDTLLRYWKRELHGDLPLLRLPTDRPRPPELSHHGLHYPVKLSASLSHELRQLALREGVSLFMTLLAAFVVLLHFYSKQVDILVGSTFANRTRPELENLIGFFVNTLPLRVDLSGHPSFRDLLAQVRAVTLGAHAHQELPLSKIVRSVRPERQSGVNPLYQVVFDVLTPDRNPAVFGYGLQSKVMERRSLGELTMQPMAVEGGTSRFDLAAFLWDMPGSVSGVLEYSTALFDRSTIALMAGRFQTLLSRAASGPDARVHTLLEGFDEQRPRQEIRDRAGYSNLLRERLKRSKRKSIRREAP